MVVTLPPHLDAVSLVALAERLEARDGPAVLEGRDAAFCLGLSLECGPDPGAVEAFVRCVVAIRCGPPVVAFVTGPARGGGVGLAAAADRVLATADASFALPEVWFGLVPGAIAPLLAERIRPAELRWLAMTGGTLTAAEARGIGLVDRVVDGSGAVSESLEALRRACPDALLELKRSTAPVEAVRRGAERTLERLRDPAVQARIGRFLDGEAPWP
ncbi:MAG: enoyl-CoA hydratase/isomerase family protein [Myxococcota bacterium]